MTLTSSVRFTGIVQAAHYILIKPKYLIEVLDIKTGGGVKVTMSLNNPDGSVLKYSHNGPNKGVAKGLCAEEALSSVTHKLNYVSMCYVLCQVYIFFTLNA